MSQLQIQPITETWIPTPWDEYLTQLNDPKYSQAKGYYHLGCMRLEMHPVGFDHSTDHSLLSLAINLYGIATGLPLTIADSCMCRKAGSRECQPDLSVYVGNAVTAIPKNTNIVNLNQYLPPNLAIEISKTTLIDDLGNKRSLYETIGIQEYWVVDVEKSIIMAYAMSNNGSHRIQESGILNGLALELLEVALQKSQTQDQSSIGSWLMGQFQTQTL
jgi:Uma2 family endonuclease